MREKKASARLISNTAIAMIVIWVIVAVLAAGGIVWWQKVYSDKDQGLYRPIDESGFFAEWQSCLAEDTNIINVAMPGSHDAATAGMMPLAETQRHSVYEQLCAGVRYLDLRVTEKNGKLVMFHSIIKGCPLDDVLKDIKKFVDNDKHYSEFIVLDFQHIGKKCDDKVIKAVEKGLDMNKAVSKKKYPYFATADAGETRALTMGRIRNEKYNYVIVWGGNEDAVRNNDHFYKREASVLSSPYDAKFHRKKDDSVLMDHFADYYDSHKGNGFFVLQSVKTSANLLMQRPMDNELKFKKTMNDYLDSLQDNDKLKDRLDKTNIVIRDYVASDPENVKAILRLNLWKKDANGKDFVKNTDKARYTEAVNAA